MNSEVWNSNVVYPKEFLDTYREINDPVKLFEEFKEWDRKRPSKMKDFDFTPLIKKAMEKK